MHKPELRLQAPLALNNARIATASRAPRTRITHQLRASTALRLMFRATAWSGVSIAIMSSASANPTGGNVVSGQASINQANPNRTEITQTTDRTAINWQSFSIGANQYTVFFQPSASSVALNRVKGPDPSLIAGHLQANGNLILVNPNGVLFSAGSQVNVHSIVATTADIRDRDFNEGRFNFSIPSPNPTATVVNEGTITVAEHGLAALVAPGTQNSGVITAKFGRVMLAGAQTFTVDLYGDGLLSFDITSKVKGANVTNTGEIQADGGVIQLAASAVDDIVAGVINMGGTIAASTVVAQTGTITADAGATGQLTVTGQVSAQGAYPGETGGAITLTGGTVAVTGGASIDASGSAGGGSIKVGGGLHGSDPSVANAQTTTIAANATLDASAVQQGDGGSVVVWSEKKTSFAGTIRAKGGAKGGDGGKVEVSSKGVLSFTGFADLRAPFGRAGTLLLDPSTLDVIAPGTDTTGVCTVAGVCAVTDSNTSNLTTTTLTGLLGSAGTVSLSADTIDFQASVPYTGTTAASLTATATAAITLENTVSISSTLAPLTVSLNAGVAGSVTFNTSSSIITHGGNLSVTAGTGGLALTSTTNLAAGDLSLTAHSLALTGTINAGAGKLILTATNSSPTGTIGESNATITAGTLTGSSGGTVNLSDGTSTNKITALDTFTTSNGDFSLTDVQPLNVTGAVNAGTGNLTLNVAGALGVGANLTDGTVTLDATGASGAINQTAGTISGTTSVALNAGGAITQTGAATISTATLTGTSTGGASLNDNNQITSLGAFTNAGSFSLTDAAATGLNVTGAVATTGAANPLSLTVAGTTLTVGGGGTLTSTGTTTITASGEGMSVGGGATGLQISDASLGNITATGGLILATQTGVGNDIAVGTVTNHAGFTRLTLQSGNDIGFNGALTVGGGTGTLDLIAAGTITENAGGMITVGTLAGNSGGTVSLARVGNAVGDVNAFAVTAGNFTLNDAGTALTIDGALSVPGILSLSANSITENPGGTIAAGPLTGTTSAGAVLLARTGNVIHDLGGFSVGGTGNFTLADGTTVLTIDGAVHAPGTLTLNAGSITENPGGTITTGVLTGTSTDAVTLAVNPNAVTNLGAFTVASDFNLNDGT